MAGGWGCRRPRASQRGPSVPHVHVPRLRDPSCREDSLPGSSRPPPPVSHGNPVPLGSHLKFASFTMLHLHLDTCCFFVITS